MITTLFDRNLRSACERRNLVLRKARRSRGLCPNVNINSGYQIVNGYDGSILTGQNFELSRENVRDWLNEYDRQQNNIK